MRLTAAKFLAAVLIATAAAGALSLHPALYASDQNDKGATFPNAVGSWFGIALPVPGETLCPPGAPGCPVPPQVVMMFSVKADGTFIGIDSSIFAALHSSCHGQWEPNGPRGIKAAFTLMQADPLGNFIGSFKNVFTSTLVNRDEMRGILDVHLYAYVDTAGAAILDSDGFPTPSPLTPASECSTTPGCTDFGSFSFIVRRVKAQ